MTFEYAQLPSYKTLWLKTVGFAPVAPTAKLVGLTIGSHMDPTGKAWPSIDRIAFMAGLSTSTVKRRIPELESAAIVRVLRGGGRHKKNVYQGLIPVHLWTCFPDELVQRVIETGSPEIETGSSASTKGSTSDPRSSTEVEVGSNTSEGPNLAAAPRLGMSPTDDLFDLEAYLEKAHA